MLMGFITNENTRLFLSALMGALLLKAASGLAGTIIGTSGQEIETNVDKSAPYHFDFHLYCTGAGGADDLAPNGWTVRNQGAPAVKVQFPEK